MIENDHAQEEQLKEYLTSFNQKGEGASLEGVVVQVDKDFVYLDVGMKSEGRVPLSDFDTVPQVGDTVTCVLLSLEGKNGEVVVSKRKADSKNLMKQLTQAFEEKTPIKGKIVKVIKGGFEVNLGAGVMAFLPLSRADIHRIEDAQRYLGLESLFLVERLYEKGKFNPVVNRKDYLQQAADAARDAFFQNTKVGDVVEGTVKSFASFGAFIDLGGFDGLLHLNDMSWGHVTKPKDYAKKDQRLKLKVVRLDPENKKINLGLKYFHEDPWATFEQRYKVNDIVDGCVTKLTDFGAFVEIEEGIEGLAHISELSWIKHIKHPKEVLSVGDKIRVCILGYDTGEEKVSLGLKQTMGNPWDDVAEKYPVGTKLTKKIKKLTASGLFVELEEGIDGFLHADNISWGKKPQNLSALYHVGDDIDVVVTEVLPDQHRISLGVKQLQENPWQELSGIQHRGEPIEVEVITKTEFGAFVRLPNGLEGLIHKINLVTTQEGNPDEELEKLAIGSKLKATIITLSEEKHRLALSVKDYVARQQHMDLDRYLTKNDQEDTKYTLADMMKKS